ncbi:unnamed protein product [Cuscuta campestris]|uniref:Uncharacterized protein n=1 Tax=Cuscuta campestris TaxID=132261 RepID=A0A484LPP3_9ASTE|nr:unnamed protein product [Cuscuta campestris]
MICQQQLWVALQRSSLAKPSECHRKPFHVASCVLFLLTIPLQLHEQTLQEICPLMRVKAIVKERKTFIKKF